MLARYLKAQLTVLLCGGLVGPIFLIVYFALGSMARPYINWMFWVGLLVTTMDVLAALALTSYSTKAAARHDELTRSGVLAVARIIGISDTHLFVNGQQMIKVNLHVDVPGQPGFDAQQTMASSPARMQVLSGHKLVALVQPNSGTYEIQWEASALLAGVTPAEFTVDEDRRTYDLTGQSGPLFEILRLLHANGIPVNGTIDIRSNPAVRRQVIDIVRRAGAQPAAPAPVSAPPADSELPPPTVSQRLQELDTLRATGAVTETEYATKRTQILGDL